MCYWFYNIKNVGVSKQAVEEKAAQIILNQSFLVSIIWDLDSESLETPLQRVSQTQATARSL